MTIQIDRADAAARTLAEEGRAVRDFIKSNRSDALLQLFDYLLQESIQGRRPKEAEIAEEVFRDSHEAASAHGSRIRVGIHRLRKKLEVYYADKSGARIVIPHGEYCLLLDVPDGPASGTEAAPGPADSRATKEHSLLLFAIALLCANVALTWYYFKDTAGVGTGSLRSTLWRGFDSGKSTRIIFGDYFMFLTKNAESGMEEPTQDLSIYNIDGFYDRTSKGPESDANIMDGDSRYVSVMAGNHHTVSMDVLEAISRLWPVIRKYKASPIAASELDASTMESANIIYVGALDALTPLIGDPLFQVSQFGCADTCYELVEKRTGRHFISASPYLLGDQIVPRHDYGYIASFPGPSGQRILVISGTGDAGVREMVSLAMDPKRLQQLGRQIEGRFASFEALYQVRTMFSQSYQSKLLIAHPINMAGVWDNTKPMNWHPAPPVQH